MTGSESFSFVTSSYLEAKALWQGRSLSRDAKRRLSNSKETSSKPFHSGRDPKSLKEVLTRSAEDLGWSVELSQARVIAVVGGQIVGFPYCSSHRGSRDTRRSPASTVGLYCLGD